MSQASFDDLLQCSICLERFTQPKLLHCSHTFCLSCLKGIIKDAGTVDCPTCRRTHQVPEQGPAGFHDNLMAANLLSMFGEIKECADCGKNQSLSECEHCQQPVCADCRVAHNLLKAEIATLIQSIQHMLLSAEGNEEFMDSVRSALKNNQEVGLIINQSFQRAAATLATRKEEILRLLGTLTKFQSAIIEGKERNLCEDSHKELSSHRSLRDLKGMKRSLALVAEMMSKTGMEFRYDSDALMNFGELVCAGDFGISKLSGEDPDSACASSGSEVAPVVFPSVDAPASGAQRLDRFPTDVDYKAKETAWKLHISIPPPGCEALKPVRAVYCTASNSLFCISEGKVLRYDAKSGAGEIVCSLFEAKDMDLTESGTLIIIDDRHILRITSDLLSSSKECDFHFTLGNLPAGAECSQICCFKKEFFLLDYARNRLLKFSENAKLICEIKDENFAVNKNTRMCVDREGRIYVSGKFETSNTGREADVICPECPLYRFRILNWKTPVHILTWDGQHSATFELTGEYKQEYRLDGKQNQCTKRKHECRLYDDPQPDRVLGGPITSMCIDGDGFMTIIARSDKPQIDVFDPERVLKYSIGDAKRNDFEDPTGVSLMPDGRLVVCDTGNNRIQII